MIVNYLETVNHFRVFIHDSFALKIWQNYLYIALKLAVVLGGQHVA
jgi:hypothetical protein